jgi:hypothetical protein
MAVIVMIPEHCKDTLWRRQVTERFDAWGDKSTIAARDVVAAKDDQIRPLGHDQVSRSFYVSSRDQLAVVQIRNQPDAQALKSWRESRNRQRRADELEIVSSVGITVSSDAAQQTSAARQ